MGQIIVLSFAIIQLEAITAAAIQATNFSLTDLPVQVE